MSSRLPYVVSRRAVLTSLAIATACRSAIAGSSNPDGSTSNDSSGPRFSPSGPNADFYGAKEAFPIADPSLTHQPGAPLEPKYRVGAFSHGDEIFPTRRIARAATPWTFKAKQDAMEDCVRGILERAVTSLMALGMTDEAALSLLMIQSAIRIDDATRVVEVLESIAKLIEDDDDDDDDCAVSKGKGSGLG